jgi:hypothetical protein
MGLRASCVPACTSRRGGYDRPGTASSPPSGATGVRGSERPGTGANGLSVPEGAGAVAGGVAVPRAPSNAGSRVMAAATEYFVAELPETYRATLPLVVARDRTGVTGYREPATEASISRSNR